ncbi:hypothetical protein [Fibrobacter sp. UWB11]|uniref:hypothetical protein n=1 Tax=Fibrobacter sp. UWB11 TaxID=1896202 RepID=UPI00092C27BB|nr:hypothetical protein [Fibrobacter sp. UWB11]SIN93889.1 hypothetical protein SAMN05720758_0669 [Fibrobacter sp. UWB11]
MFYKHWKKIALALTAFFWGGCNDNSTSSKEQVACSFTGECPEYGVAGYYCEDGISPDDNGQNCTYVPGPTCSIFYNCDDGVSCLVDEGGHVLKCKDKQDKDFSIQDTEFFTKYYIDPDK